MTIEESLKRRLDVRLAKHGESDFSAQQLKAQLASLKHFKRVKLAGGEPEVSPGGETGTARGPQGGHVRKRDTGRPGGESAGGGGGELSFALKPGKFQGGATAKNATFRRKTPKPNYSLQQRCRNTIFIN
jgi:hypothetical protein